MGTNHYEWQEALLCAERIQTPDDVTGSGTDMGEDPTTCPWEAMREDVGEMVKREESDKSSVMLLGDFNFTWDNRTRVKAKELSGEPLSRSNGWKLWATKYMKFTNVVSDMMTSPVPTFHRFNGEGRENSQDDKDMILMRAELRDTAVIGVGVMDCDTMDGAPSNSEHWPVAVELSMKAVFGTIGQVTQHPKLRSNMPVLRSTTKSRGRFGNYYLVRSKRF